MQSRCVLILSFVLGSVAASCSGGDAAPRADAASGGTAGGGGGGGPGGRGGDASGGSSGGGSGGSPRLDAATAGPDAGRPDAPGRPDAATDLAGDAASDLPRFSFFVTSIESMRTLSGSQNGFGGDLRFGEATGLAGADKICRTIAETAVPGSGQKGWRAFLSASTGGVEGAPVHAIERIGSGPWYDRTGRVVAMNIQGLLAGPRPQGGDPQLAADMPNERGAGNHQGVDNHDTLTATNRQGRFAGTAAGAACDDWTSAVAGTGRPTIGHSWPRNPGNVNNGGHWMSDHTAPGCAPGVNISSGGGGGGGTVGGGGGYGGIYCFALTP